MSDINEIAAIRFARAKYLCQPQTTSPFGPEGRLSVSRWTNRDWSWQNAETTFEKLKTMLRTERGGNTPGTNSSLFKWGRVRLSSFKCTRGTRGLAVHVSHATCDTVSGIPSRYIHPCDVRQFRFQEFLFLPLSLNGYLVKNAYPRKNSALKRIFSNKGNFAKM